MTTFDGAGFDYTPSFHKNMHSDKPDLPRNFTDRRLIKKDIWIKNMDITEESMLGAGADKTSQPLSERVASALIGHIVREGLSAGEKLPNEKILCEQLEVGRSTLREAVRMLASRNILVVRHGSGIYVSDKPGLSEDPLGLAFIRDKAKLVLDLVDFRLMMEPRATALAAQKAGEEQIEALEQLMLAVEHNISIGKSHAVEDAAFHTKIAEMSGNIILPKLEPILFRSIELFAHMCVKNSRQETIDSHREIVESIRKHDAMAAMDAMVMHLTLNRNSLLQNLRQQQVPAGHSASDQSPVQSAQI